MPLDLPLFNLQSAIIAQTNESNNNHLGSFGLLLHLYDFAPICTALKVQYRYYYRILPPPAPTHQHPGPATPHPSLVVPRWVEFPHLEPSLTQVTLV